LAEECPRDDEAVKMGMTKRGVGWGGGGGRGQEAAHEER